MNTVTTVQEQRIDDAAQEALAVTIYNDNLALVKDLRRLTLTQGENRLAWRNCSARIRPETALLSETSGALQVSLLEQNFDFDLLTPKSLLKKYLGRQVQVIRANDAGERTSEEATVLATNKGVILRYADRIEGGIHHPRGSGSGSLATRARSWPGRAGPGGPRTGPGPGGRRAGRPQRWWAVCARSWGRGCLGRGWRPGGPRAAGI